jgi:hypothetical protein
MGKHCEDPMIRAMAKVPYIWSAPGLLPTALSLAKLKLMKNQMK